MTSLPPGWYKDPADPSTQRWWDGEGWLGKAIPADAVPPDGPPPDETPTSPAPTSGTPAPGVGTPGLATPGTAAPDSTTPGTTPGPTTPVPAQAPGTGTGTPWTGAGPSGWAPPGAQQPGWTPPGAAQPPGQPAVDLPPGWQPPPGWTPPNTVPPAGQAPPTPAGWGPPPGWQAPPGWQPPPGSQPPAGWQPLPGWQPPPGWQPHPPGTPGYSWAYVPQLRPHGFALAGFGRRLVARMVDFFVVLLLNVVVNGWFAYQWWQEVEPVVRAAMNDPLSEPQQASLRANYLVLTMLFIATALWFAYEVPAIANRGQTLGKRLMQVKVVRLENTDQLGFGRSFRRWARLGLWTPFWGCYGLGLLLQFIDSVSPLFDARLRQALHDKTAQTVVVALPAKYRRPVEAAGGGDPTGGQP
ncbi:RDD family protein [Krasilnikovia sp. MM14-A1259]|uniref:RDD family protein n=1 Tax=Krasilnikovia sp. MM14-A1259 TaxID=3373539 RepID=UPI00380E7AD8